MINQMLVYIIISGLIGIIFGSLLGAVVTYMVQKNKMLDLQDEVYDSHAVRQALKEEIFRLSTQGKPKPRKRRGKPKGK